MPATPATPATPAASQPPPTPVPATPSTPIVAIRTPILPASAVVTPARVVQTITPIDGTVTQNATPVAAAVPAGQVVSGAVGVVVTRPVQHITQIRLQPQPVNNALQKKGLALTVISVQFFVLRS